MRLWKSPLKKDLGTGKYPDQVVRLALIFGVGLIGLLVLRQKFIPASFGEFGHFRGDAIGANAAHEPRFAGRQACPECHESQAELKASSYHRLLSCETCHGPAMAHVIDAEESGMPEIMPLVPKAKTACLTCHSYLPSRPTGFPQIIEMMHNPAEACTKCHDPHDPTPPEVPGACSGCHGQIARTKAISHHSALRCETCHKTPDAHKENPRSALPQKPRDRTFCGQCHAKGAEIDQDALGVELDPRSVPRVDMNDHGGSYQCWQCHYPHFPESL